MAESFVIATVQRTALANDLNTDLSTGQLKIYSGASPGPNSAATGTLLGTFTLPASGSNSVAAGVITFGSITNVLAASAGTAGYGRFLKSDGTTVVGDGNCGTSATTIVLSTTTFTNGAVLSITSATMTVPAGT